MIEDRNAVDCDVSATATCLDFVYWQVRLGEARRGCIARIAATVAPVFARSHSRF